MITIMFDVQDSNATSALSAINPFAVGKIRTCTEYVLPTPSAKNINLNHLAREIAEKIKPSGKQTMRLEALDAALNGYDSFEDQQGEKNDSMRVALGALSKALRPFSNSSSPIELIADRTKRYSQEGTYLGTKYTPTDLGKRIHQILVDEGVLSA